jgi:sulfonate transport system substrate-binding protein
MLWLAAGLLAMASPVRAETTVTIGYQKYGTLIILKEKGTLEKALAPLGYSVRWAEFFAGPPLLEAMGAGAVVFGTTGETPPVFAQAGGSPVVYVGVEPPAPDGEAIIVPKDSTLRTLADLRGKTVGVTKGSNAHYLLLSALASAQLAPADIKTVFLAPADARAAFEAGKLDAWSIWDPYLAAAGAATGARILSSGVGLISNHQFYLASHDFAAAHPEIVRAILTQIAAVDAWSAAHKPDVSQLLSERVGLPLPVVTASVDRLTYGVGPITPEIVAKQQQIADTLFRLHVIPSHVSVGDIVWSPPS